MDLWSPPLKGSQDEPASFRKPPAGPIKVPLNFWVGGMPSVARVGEAAWEGWARPPGKKGCGEQPDRNSVWPSEAPTPSWDPRRLPFSSPYPSLPSSSEGGLSCLSRPRDLGEGEESGAQGKEESSEGHIPRFGHTRANPGTSGKSTALGIRSGNPCAGALGAKAGPAAPGCPVF